MPNSLKTVFSTSLLATLLLCCLTLSAQDKGYWRATSTTARSITGDVSLSEDKLSINFTVFPIARIRSLDGPETAALFDADSNAPGPSPGSASLYRLIVPATQKFLHKNNLCGGEDTHWMVTYASGRSLQVAFFSGQKPPTLTLEAIPNSTDLCGTFTYAR